MKQGRDQRDGLSLEERQPAEEPSSSMEDKNQKESESTFSN